MSRTTPHEAPPGSRTGRWVGRVLLLAVATLAGLGLAELAIRALGMAPDPGLFTGSEADFRRVPGTFAPNQESVQSRGSRFEHVATINSLGYRGADFPMEKPSGEVRVLFAGDSFTWGHNVEDDETLPAQLQARLAASCGASLVVNAGLSGSTILGQQAIVQRGLAVDPDLVIVMHHENDLDELMYSRIWEQLAANRRVKSRFPVSVVYPVLRSTAIWNLALHARRVIQSGREDDVRTEVESSDTDEPPQLAEARREYATRLAALRDTLGAVQIPFVFLMYPHPASVREGHGGRDYDWVRRTAEDLGIATLDLLPPLRREGPSVEEAYLVPDDYHPSPEGFAFASRVVAEYVGSGALSPRCEGPQPLP